MSFQTVQNDDDNRGHKSKKALESALIAIWLGKWLLFQTFEELDNAKDKQSEVLQVRQLLDENQKEKTAC